MPSPQQRGSSPTPESPPPPSSLAPTCWVIWNRCNGRTGRGCGSCGCCDDGTCGLESLRVAWERKRLPSRSAPSPGMIPVKAWWKPPLPSLTPGHVVSHLPPIANGGGASILFPPYPHPQTLPLLLWPPYLPHIVSYKNNTSRAHPGYRASPCGSFVSIRKKASFALDNPSLPGSHLALSWCSYDCDGGGWGAGRGRALLASSLSLNFSIWAQGQT